MGVTGAQEGKRPPTKQDALLPRCASSISLNLTAVKRQQSQRSGSPGNKRHFLLCFLSSLDDDVIQRPTSFLCPICEVLLKNSKLFMSHGYMYTQLTILSISAGNISYDVEESQLGKPGSVC